MIVKNSLAMRTITKTLMVVAAILFIASSIPIASSAATYLGRGSKADPYLVQTKEQLDGMRNNPSAFYKLANTIDLSSVANFTPIGYIAKPFTGGFTCDLGADKKPLYAIKNLTVTVNGAANYTDYKKNESKWEAALFGASDGATFTNILVLDAKITNNVIGQNKMNSDFSKNPGQDEQAAAILVGLALNTTITGCGTTGTVTSKCNDTAGLVASIVGGNVKNCYSYATVKNVGYWNTGGLIGFSDANVSNSFYSGSVKGGIYTVGGLIGHMSTTTYKVTNCYSEGTVDSSVASSFIGEETRTPQIPIINFAKNCYTTSKIVGRTKAQTNTKVTNGNYITDAVGGLQMGFGVASSATILTAFKSVEGWKTTGVSYPQLIDVYPVKSSSGYKPVAVSTASNQSGTQSASNTGSIVSNSDTSSNGTASDDQSTISGDSSNITATGGENTKINMDMAELTLIIVLTSLIVLSIAGSTFTMILIYRRQKTK